MITRCLLIILAVVTPLQAKEWRGIVPLHSTRVDVERLLGPAQVGTNGSYKTERERVLVLYSDEPCGLNSGGWKVPRDTVISITVEPFRKLKLADLKLDMSKYNKERDDDVEFIVYYRNDEDGISYEVNTGEGVINAIRYFPAVKDGHVRCPTAAARKACRH